MADINPYAAPKHEGAAETQAAEGGEDVWGDGAGAWRDGDLLVMHKHAALPDRCVKCNRPAGDGRLKCTLICLHPIHVFLLFWLGPIAYLMAYAITTLMKRHVAKIQIGFCETHRRKRRDAILLSWVFALAGLAAIFLSTFLAGVNHTAAPYAQLLLFGGVIALAGVSIYWIIAGTVVAAEKMDEEYVWIKKAAPAYLEEFPDY